MLNMEGLREFGADVDEGLERCMGNEGFYLRMIGLAAQDKQIDKLVSLTEAGKLEEAFEVAHSLKGMYANLALTPISDPITEITEYLRKGTERDYSVLLDEIIKQKQHLDDLMK